MNLQKWTPFLSLTILLLASRTYSGPIKEQPFLDNLIVSEKQIHIPGFPSAFNPSLEHAPGGYLLSFRNCPDDNKLWVSNIGLIFLDFEFNPISEPLILNTRQHGESAPSQSEDARLFQCGDRLFMIYNDNIEVINPDMNKRRDMFLAEITFKDGQVVLSKPLKLIHHEEYPKQKWQKNWSPFVYNGQICLIYSITPHEIIVPDLVTGICHVKSSIPPPFSWRWGHLRGGTQALLVDGVYLTFFHSSIRTSWIEKQYDEKITTYFMGAYVFSPEPPFQILAKTSKPIIARDFYSNPIADKRVVFPGGFVVNREMIHIAYGRNDMEIWIASLKKQMLFESLTPIDYYDHDISKKNF